MNESLGPELFEQLFHTYYEKLHYYAYTILKDSEEASDIVQTAFVKLWEKMGEIDIHDNLGGYLYRSVHNLSLNLLRQDKNRRKYVTAQRRDSDAWTVNDTRDKLLVSEWGTRIKEAMDSLPTQCGIIFRKSREEGKKYSEIAGELGISVKTVEVQMGKALKLLRSKLTIRD
jgi:RNA polymerase sigma-70 factor (ECF subfamily)